MMRGRFLSFSFGCRVRCLDIIMQIRVDLHRFPPRKEDYRCIFFSVAQEIWKLQDVVSS